MWADESDHRVRAHRNVIPRVAFVGLQLRRARESLRHPPTRMRGRGASRRAPFRQATTIHQLKIRAAGYSRTNSSSVVLLRGIGAY